ncbi:hypothetical protein BSKO_10010 [Bryopsis sp. KO-2023]|nr:hypothetical protein BSKO_10010 [Bryopsis sp. KO-2023]
MRYALESLLRLHGSSWTKSPVFAISKLCSLQGLMDAKDAGRRGKEWGVHPVSRWVEDGRRGFVGGMLSDGCCEKKHTERKLLGYSPEQLFTVVSSVEHYQDFVPWCVKSTLLKREGNYAEAELEVGFQVFVERYLSRIKMQPPHALQTATDESTLFHHLNSEWKFEPGPTPTTCQLHFHVDFAFKSQLYRQVASVFFEEVVKKMLGALENRCETVYGPSSMVKSRKVPKAIA